MNSDESSQSAHTTAVVRPLTLTSSWSYKTVDTNNSEITLAANNSFLAVKTNRGKIIVVGESSLVVVQDNSGAIELGGKFNEVRVLVAGSSGKVSACGSHNKLNGVTLVGSVVPSTNVESEMKVNSLIRKEIRKTVPINSGGVTEKYPHEEQIIHIVADAPPESAKFILNGIDEVEKQNMLPNKTVPNFIKNDPLKNSLIATPALQHHKSRQQLGNLNLSQSQILPAVNIYDQNKNKATNLTDRKSDQFNTIRPPHFNFTKAEPQQIITATTAKETFLVKHQSPMAPIESSPYYKQLPPQPEGDYSFQSPAPQQQAFTTQTNQDLGNPIIACIDGRQIHTFRLVPMTPGPSDPAHFCRGCTKPIDTTHPSAVQTNCLHWHHFSCLSNYLRLTSPNCPVCYSRVENIGIVDLTREMRMSFVRPIKVQAL